MSWRRWPHYRWRFGWACCFFGARFGALTSAWRKPVIYLTPPVAVLAGGLAWAAMVLAYAPTLSLYGLSPLRGLALPVIAGLYTLMTLSSALRHWQGRGGAWKGRFYGPSE